MYIIPVNNLKKSSQILQLNLQRRELVEKKVQFPSVSSVQTNLNVHTNIQ